MTTENLPLTDQVQVQNNSGTQVAKRCQQEAPEFSPLSLNLWVLHKEIVSWMQIVEPRQIDFIHKIRFECIEG